jgi:hypothetical protein
MTGQLFDLSHLEREMADVLVDLGQTDRASRFLQDKLRLFESLLESHADSPDLILARILILAALGKPVRASLASHLGRTERATPGSPLHTMLVRALAELTARRYGFRILGPLSSGEERADPEDSAAARQAVRFLAEQTSELGLGPEVVHEAASRMGLLISSMASHLRSVGNHEQARRIARRFSALAAEFVRSYPGRAEPYLLVCDEHLQDAKNASRSGDSSKVRTSLVQSLEAAVKAQTIDPSSDEARRVVLDRRHRLEQHESEVNQVPAEVRDTGHTPTGVTDRASALEPRNLRLGK